MTDTLTTAPPLLSRHEIEAIERGWTFHAVEHFPPLDRLCTTALAAYDPSGKLWSERAREAEDEWAASLKRIAGDFASQVAMFEDRIDTLTRALADERELVGKLRDDLERFVGDTDAYACEGCGAPIGHDEEAATTADVQGCWGYVSDVQGAPCYRYRTRAGAERSWPPCAALPPPDLSSCPRCETME
jgi:hypothetical protein